MRGLNNRLKRINVFNKIRKEKYDFYFLQETYATDETVLLWQKEWGGKILYSNGTSKKCGVAILVKRNLDCKVITEYADKCGRVITAVVKVDDIDFTLCNVYSPNNDDPDFFQLVGNQIAHTCCENVIWAGDFNLIINEKLDCKHRSTNNYKALSKLKAIMEDTGLEDVWRVLSP